MSKDVEKVLSISQLFLFPFRELYVETCTPFSTELFLFFMSIFCFFVYLFYNLHTSHLFFHTSFLLCQSNGVLCHIETSQLYEVPFINCYSFCLYYWCSFQKLTPMSKSSRILCDFSSDRVTLSLLMFCF